MSPPAPLLCIVGPTATGKTALAVAVAQRCDGALLNADSRQVIHGLRVATCVPTADALRGVTCHLLDLCQPGEDFSVASWLEHAEAALVAVRAAGRRPIVVGGTGLYVSALVDGLMLGGVPASAERRRTRELIAARPQGPAILARELLERDPGAAEHVALANARRVIRALELLDAHGGTVQAARGRGAGHAATLVGIDAPRPAHAAMVRRRAEQMLAGAALLDEIDAALSRGVERDVLVRCGIGYAEGLELLAGSIDAQQAVERIVARTMRYAKAQRTWFRPRVRAWLEVGPALEVERLATDVLAIAGAGSATA